MPVDAISNNNNSNSTRIAKAAIGTGAIGALAGATILARPVYKNAFSLISLDKDKFENVLENVDKEDPKTAISFSTMKACNINYNNEITKFEELFSKGDVSINDFKQYSQKELAAIDKNITAFDNISKQLAKLRKQSLNADDIFSSILSDNSALEKTMKFSEWMNAIENHTLTSNKEGFSYLKKELSKTEFYEMALPVREFENVIEKCTESIKNEKELNASMFNSILETAKDNKIKKADALPIFKNVFNESLEAQMKKEGTCFMDSLKKYLPKTRVKEAVLFGICGAITGASAAYIFNNKFDKTS